MRLLCASDGKKRLGTRDNGIACAWLWIRVVRIVECIKELNFQEILLEMQRDSIKKKMEERSKELEELIRWQKEKSGA